MAALRIGLAGAGMVSAHHLEAWRKLAGCRVDAIADPDIAAARQRAEAFGIAKVYASVADMLDAERVDALDVAVPMQHHHAVAAEAAARGIAILLQKPIAPTLALADALVDDVGDRARLMIHENWRFRPYYRKAREWIAEGRIGRPATFRFEVESSGLLPPPGGGVPPALVRQPFLASLDRLIVLELLVHHLDTVRALLGDVAVVAARTTRISSQVRGEDTASILLAGDDGLTGLVFGSMALAGRSAAPTDRLFVAGSRGAITCSHGLLELRGADGSYEQQHFDPDACYQAAYDNAIAHFAHCLRTGEAFETSAEDNLKTLALVEDVYSRAAGRTMLG